MKRNQNKILVVFVIILSILVIALSSYLIYDKIINKDNDELNENNIVENNQENTSDTLSIEEILTKFVGNYEYGEKMESELLCGSDSRSGTDYHDLELKSDGTYTYISGMNCGSGFKANGNYAISDNKIYLYNDECNIALVGEECMYPNCEKVIELDYSEVNNEIVISVYNNQLERK